MQRAKCSVKNPSESEDEIAKVKIEGNYREKIKMLVREKRL
jgi:hypothetical protein